MRRYVPYWYQIGTQLGYGDVPTGHVADLIRHHSGGIEARDFVPRDFPMAFDAAAMPDIDRWVRRHGSRLLFANGTQDPSVAEYLTPAAATAGSCGSREATTTLIRTRAARRRPSPRPGPPCRDRRGVW
ncbi:hypothetical protein [Streptomyces sp. NPDC050164]|uniref:hypothetical protein n=1 Tax=Streptomyces sp. NPDC050164 TaxID=3365605 RepID=UPI0037A191B4